MIERFARVATSNIKKVLQSIEDPEKVLDQAVVEMQSDLIKVKQSYAQVLATLRRLTRQKDQAESMASNWHMRAESAVENGDDHLAKEALTRRQSFLDKAADLEGQIGAMDGNVERLFDSIKTLEEKIQQSRNEKEHLIARARVAKTTNQVNEMLSDVSTSGSLNAFKRMKEKVDIMETRAEVSESMPALRARKDSLEERFKALEGGNRIEDELAKLKGSKALPA